MIESIAFQTKARTLDHLGREQIADCPTAISELWKNSFDAYALHLVQTLGATFTRIGLDFVGSRPLNSADAAADKKTIAAN